MPALTSIALGVSAAAGVANAAANMSASDRAAAIQDKALQEWMKLNIPDPEQQKIAMQRFVDQGELSPQLEKAISQNPSEFQKITTSVADRTAQNRALQELEKIGYEGGLRLQDKVALQDATLEGQMKDRANREAITADMARRGMGGSGFEFASQLAAQQSGADRDARNSLQIAAQAQDRALQSIMGAGDMATKFRTQDFNEQAQKAAAQDAINRFNTSNLQDVHSRNIASQNRAQEMNLADKQRIADANINLANDQEKYNKSLLQQKFDNQAKIAAGKSGQYGQMGALEQQKGQALGNAFTNVGQAATGALTTQANHDFWTKKQEQRQQEEEARKNQDYWSNYFNK
jgi:hypothetical protein